MSTRVTLTPPSLHRAGLTSRQIGERTGLNMQAVCTTCHHAREDARRAA